MTWRPAGGVQPHGSNRLQRAAPAPAGLGTGRVAHTRDLAEQAWPGLPDYALGPASARAGINGVGRIGPSAVVEAHAVALLLTVLIRRAARTRAMNGRGT
jgi:hypothetical protein